jgi:2-keto-4-pentenoate hydratase/2-oxohepta-3-ene-1,7-dioic acid hydratase in catechol pathway
MRYAHLRDTDAPLAAVVDDRVVPLAGRLDGIATLDGLIAAGPDAWAAAEGLARDGVQDGSPRVDEAALAAPLAAPSKIVCVGLNYHDHCVETGTPVPQRPLLFAKLPSSLSGPGDPIAWPAGLTEQVDWEAELAVVIGRRLKGAGLGEVLDGVFGYTAANDVSARDLQFSDGQWTRGKSIDGFCPLGPVVVTADEYGDPQGRPLAARVNGETMQDSSTDRMIFDVATILSFTSQAITLEPGDLVLTGTPAGCGGFRSPPVFLAPGDVVEVEVDGIGVLRNPVGA